MPERRSAEATATPWLETLANDDAERHIVVLASSRRLCRSLINQHNERMLARGHAGWATPPVFFWQDWLFRLIDELDDARSRRVLPPASVLACWEQSLSQHLPEGVSGVAGLARQAAASARLLAEWSISANEVSASARSVDERVFADSLKTYRRMLDKQNATDPTALAALAVERLADGEVPLPDRAVVLGFDRISPLAGKLLETLQQAGVDVLRPQPPEPEAGPVMHEYADEDAELRAAGAWARQQRLDRPEARVAIVVSELEQDTVRIGRLIREGYTPGWQLGGSDYEASVELSYGRRLADYPVIATALSVLEWVAAGLDSAAVSVLLRSPALGAAAESDKARLELRLRDFPNRNWTPAALADALTGRDVPIAVAGLLERIRDLSRQRGRLTGKRVASAWARDFDDLLSAVGWPGDAGLNSLEFQTVNRWRELLNEMAGLDAVLGELSLSQAVRRVHSMAMEVVYQPDNDRDSLPVIGPLEAAGLTFDALWIARCDAERWPSAGQPQPLVSRRLQVARQMPDATPADTLEYARRVLSRLASSAPEVRFSWSSADLDAVRLPSPLLLELGCRPDAAPADPHWFARARVGAGDLAVIENDVAPPLEPGEQLVGGVRAVQLQRSEPFSAFAVGRLGVRDIESFQTGMTPRLRGILTHSALERLYAEGLSRDELAAWSDTEREQKILAAVDRSLAAVERYADAVLRRLLSIERRRMARVLGAVIHGDLEREPFVIESLEQRLAYRHAGVVLDLRADRIDRLADNSLLILDYKTGQPRPLIRQTGEVADLQLPVYAAAVNASVGGLGFLFVGPKTVTWKQAGSSIDVKPMEADDWAVTLDIWRLSVERLIEAIVAGDTRVNLRGDAERSWQLNVLCRSAEEKRGG